MLFSGMTTLVLVSAAGAMSDDQDFEKEVERLPNGGRAAVSAAGAMSDNQDSEKEAERRFKEQLFSWDLQPPSSICGWISLPVIAHSPCASNVVC